MTVWDTFCQAVGGKRILIFGLGLQGGGTESANTLVSAGAIVRATDSKSAEELEPSLKKLDSAVEGIFGHHRLEDIEWADIILKNPAVPFSQPLIQKAQALGKLVVTETAWALQFTHNQTIGITGTRGKTTTSHLIHAILQADGRKALLCGNIPDRPALSFLSEIESDTLLVMEISSFHLESSNQLRVSPKYAVVTNVYPDHLNRYDSVEAYAQVKAEIFAHQHEGDHAFYGNHHDWSNILARAIQPEVTRHLLTLADFESAADFSSPLPGKHNLENIAFATEVARTLGVADGIIRQTVQGFHGVPYRLETIGTFGGITFINDTTSTTPTALEKALESMTEPFVLIAGGTTKHLPFPQSLKEKLQQKPTDVIWLTGSGTDELGELPSRNNVETGDSRSLSTPGGKFPTLSQAVTAAIDSAKRIGVKTILFSPGFSSFEMFRNEFDRGEQFNRIVRALGET